MELETLKSFVIWLLSLAFLAFMVISVISGLFVVTPFMRDDTDEPGWFGKRSGVTPVTDNLTGCQYIRTANGGITPRLDASGRQICREVTEGDMKWK